MRALDMLADEEQNEDFEESSSQSTSESITGMMMKKTTRFVTTVFITDFRPALMTSNGVCNVLQLMLTPDNLRHYRFVLMRKPNGDGVLEVRL